MQTIASIIEAKPHFYLLGESSNGATFPYHPDKWDEKSLHRQWFAHGVITMFDHDLIPRHTCSQTAASQILGAAPLTPVSPVQSPWKPWAST